MRWSKISPYRLFLVAVYALALPLAIYCFIRPFLFSAEWALLTVTSLFVATINVRLPKISSVISMGDVFVILALLYFGPGPALLTYWADNVVAQLSDGIKKHGLRVLGKVPFDRFCFNLSCCALSVASMDGALRGVRYFQPDSTVLPLFSLAAIALSWFFVNTATVSLAISFWMNRGFLSVWREGLGLYVLNFAGSAAAAGLIRAFHDGVDTSVFFLSIPIAVVLLQLYRFHISKYEQAQTHIADLSRLYLQTVETLAAAVDAKDRYTHGHIRRVQSFASELAKCAGITDEPQLMAIKTGALLHDIGKIAIPEFILNKPSALTDSEYGKMRLHPVVGSNMLKHIEFPYEVVPMVRSHHERWDGNGYPDGLNGNEIPLGARILALVDCYDALTTDRPYRSPMGRDELIVFLRSESGKAYDPSLVETLIENLDRIECVGRMNVPATTDIWGVTDAIQDRPSAVRPLQKVQPISTYGKALTSESAQVHLFAVFEFARANIQCLSPSDIFAFMGRKLGELVAFDAAVFFLSDLDRGVVVASHVEGEDGAKLKNMCLPLEKKLTGWVASTNQGLCNLPPFPDFSEVPTPPALEISAIAPMNRNGTIWGAISVYRRDWTKFTDEEFRQIEIVASQTAIALSGCYAQQSNGPLVDPVTGLPNGYHLHLVFQQLALDAQKFDYTFALIVFRVDFRRVRNRWGYAPSEEVVRIAAAFLRKEFREDDLLVRYAAGEYCAIVPRVDRSRAESLKVRLLEEFSKLPIFLRGEIPARVKLVAGVSVFPEDGLELDTLLSICHWQIRQRRDEKAIVPMPRN